mmetsp:Transcript_68209/g.142544  ORF Transcript_68209/g.142544 Transcript_68209/m.142544 type:complete len:116 (-) Transcript_68209:1170-1517(-)
MLWAPLPILGFKRSASSSATRAESEPGLSPSTTTQQRRVVQTPKPQDPDLSDVSRTEAKAQVAAVEWASCDSLHSTHLPFFSSAGSLRGQRASQDLSFFSTSPMVGAVSFEPKWT